MSRRNADAGTTKTARLFTQGGSQAVRLPAEFRFAGDFVFVRRDKLTGDVVLSSRPPSHYADFMAVRDALASADQRSGPGA